MLVVLLTLPAAAILLGLRNLRRGQGDRRGATRIAVTMFVMLFTAAMLRAHHVPEVFAEWSLVTRLVIDNTFLALAFWMAYVAVEPLVRRHWPRMLISSSRLLEGRWRDPMIGRDLLLGSALGAVVALSAHGTALLGSEPLTTNATSIASVRHTLYLMLLHASAQAIGRSLLGAVLLLVLRAVFRRMSVVLVVAVILGALSVADMPGGPAVVRVAWTLMASCAVYAIVFRLGLLALSAASFSALMLLQMPLTADPAAPYFGTSMLVAGSVVAIALFGFWHALGGKSPLPRLAMDY
jgi:serine/threonine-protein kinase